MKPVISLSLLAAISGAIWIASEEPSSADSIILKNGAVIHGDTTVEGSRVKIDFGAAGSIIIPQRDVAKIVEDELNDFERDSARPVPSADTPPVRVSIKAEKTRYGTGAYLGWEEESSDDRVLVLRLPEGGRVRILRDDIAAIEKTSPGEVATSGPRPAVEPGDDAPAAAEARTIATTHVVTLANGRKVQGNVLESTEAEPLLLEIPGLGITAIRRGQIAAVEEAAGTIEIPAPPAAPETTPPATTGDAEATADELDALRERLREEILRDLLEAVIDEKIDEAVSIEADLLELGAIAESIGAEKSLELQFYARELGRQRTPNRVRAESHLEGEGYLALPFLLPAVEHPFELTRRAAMRIVRSARDVRGTPLAIQGLTDSDVWVRRLAKDALGTIFTARVAYDPEGSPASWRAAEATYRALWNEFVKVSLESAAARQL